MAMIVENINPVSLYGPISLPQRSPRVYSRKVFFGGVPWQITEGYVYVCFKEEPSVNSLLSLIHCDENESNGDKCLKWKIYGKSGIIKELRAEIIPWRFADSFWISDSLPFDNPDHAVFIGGLHGLMTAQCVAKVFNNLFGCVGSVFLFTDKFEYPTGSGKVSFTSIESYQTAVQSSFVLVTSRKCRKIIQVDPFIHESAPCADCGEEEGRYFCRETQECIKLCCNYCVMQHCMMTGHPVSKVADSNQ